MLQCYRVTAAQIASVPMLLPLLAFNDRPDRLQKPQESLNGKAPQSPIKPVSPSAKAAGRWTRPDIKHTSVYLPEAAYEALRQVAFDERCKIHDLLIEGVESALKKRGYPALAELKAKSQRKERR